MSDAGHTADNRAATTFRPLGHWIEFTCGCGHVFLRKPKLVYDPCPKCGQLVSSIARATVRYG